jgi:CBS domain-containing protein
VLENRRLVGIVSQRDLLAASLSRVLDFDAPERRTFLRSVDVAETMTRDVITVHPETPLPEAARLLLRHAIGCLPVVAEDGTPVGLVTETDLVRAAYLEGEAE